MIKVHQLTRRYGNFLAVNSVSFEIPRGQIVGLLGRNGAGKTTTLKMITGYLEPSEGTVTIAGMELNDENRLAIQNKIGYLPESSPLYPDMTVVSYLHYVAQLRGMDLEAAHTAVEQALDATDLRDRIMQNIGTLSKGYKQRVGVAQAILHKPEILILDEPTNGLDPTQILAMRQLIKNLSESTTVIISTHIMQEVEAICDRALIILDGRLAKDSLLVDLQNVNTITLTVSEKPETVKPALGAMSSVSIVDVLPSDEGSRYSYQISLKEKDESFAPKLAKLAVDKGWNLYGLQHDHRNLEAVFKEVNVASSKGVAHV